MGMLPAGAAAWVGKTRHELQPHPQLQLSCGCLPRVPGILSAAPYATPAAPTQPTLCSLGLSRQKEEGRRNGGLAPGGSRQET